jgi:hypothetical protein
MYFQSRQEVQGLADTTVQHAPGRFARILNRRP